MQDVTASSGILAMYELKPNPSTLVRCEWLGRCDQIILPHVHPMIINHFAKQHSEFTQTRSGTVAYNTIYGYTEYKRDGILFRAHPEYHGRGAWYDWAVISFDKDGEYPCKLLMFYNDPTNDNKPSALVHPCSGKDTSDPQGYVKICQRWLLDYGNTSIHSEEIDTIADGEGPTYKTIVGHSPKLCTVELECIVAPVFVVESNPGVHEFVQHDDDLPSSFKEVLAVTDPATVWADEFTTMTPVDASGEPLASSSNQD